MHNIKFIRENPRMFEEKMKMRNFSNESEKILLLDSELRGHKKEINEVQQIRNTKSKEIGELIINSKDPSTLQREVKLLKKKLVDLDMLIKKKTDHLDDILLNLPNILEPLLVLITKVMKVL